VAIGGEIDLLALFGTTDVKTFDYGLLHNPFTRFILCYLYSNIDFGMSWTCLLKIKGSTSFNVQIFY
jgi:hypothetical protein